jgi:hypothetical protein
VACGNVLRLFCTVPRVPFTKSLLFWEFRYAKSAPYPDYGGHVDSGRNANRI